MRPHLAVQIATIVVAFAALQGPASAQGFFDWFSQRHDDRYARQNSGSGQRQDWFGQQQRQYTPQVSAYSDPGAIMQERQGPASAPSIGGGTGRAVAYCVRLCDGRYFPMQRHANATPVAALQRVLPGGQDAGVQRQRRSTTPREQRRALCRSGQCVRLPPEDRRGLHLQRQGRFRPRAHRCRGRPDPAAGRYRGRPATIVKAALTAMAPTKERGRREAASEQPAHAARAGAARPAKAAESSAGARTPERPRMPED